MKKTLALLLVLTLVLSTLFCVAVAADEAVARVSLWNNLSYYSEAVPEGTKLNVSAYNAANEELDISGKEITYKSSRPWVVDVDENGYIVDYGYLGSTIITATVDGVDGSLILIKTDGDGPGSYNRTLFVHDGDNAYNGDQHAFTFSDGTPVPYNNPGYIYARAFNNDYNASTGKVTSAVTKGGERDFDNDPATNNGTYGNITIGGGNADWSILLDYRTLPWDTQGQLRMQQIWFYDDGESPVNITMNMTQKMAGMNDNGWGVNSAWQASTGNKTVGYYWYGNLKADEGAESYSTSASYTSINTIKRTEGWHQATSVIDEAGAIKLYVDGEEFLSAKLDASDNAYSNFKINVNNVGKYDDIVTCGNPNTEKPAEFKLPAESISLSENKTFYSAAVPEGTELVVTPVDANGDEGVFANPSYTYESTRPWVVDVVDGKLVDGGYDGSTIITVKEINSGAEASVVIIKSTSDTTITSGFESDKLTAGSTVQADGYAYYGYRNGAPTTKNDSNSRIAGESYIVGGNGALVYRGAWDNDQAANIRIAQGWFYDDTVNDVKLGLSFGNNYPKKVAEGSYTLGGTAVDVKDGSNGYVPAWAEIGLDASIDAAVSNTDDRGYYIHGIVGASATAAGQQADTSYYYFSDNQYDSPIKRTKGWHQATLMIDDDANVSLYIDGVKVNHTVGYEKKLKAHNAVTQSTVQGATANALYDDFVFAQNLNETRPEEYRLPAESISLSENTSFYLNEVPSGTKLIVTPIDVNGDVGKFETQPTYTYESTRPWVLDIADDGTIVDGGYDGSTNVTVTASFANGQQYTASLIFIVASDNGYNAGEALGGKLYRDDVNGYDYINGYVGRTYLSGSSSTKPTTGGHDNGDYIAKGGTKGSNQDNSAALAGVGISWDVTAKIRLMQGWFYDDGASEFEMYFDASAAENSDAYKNEGFMPDWPNYAYGRAYRHRCSIVAAENSTAYSLNDLDNSNSVVYPINRSKGWHQATLVINSDGTINYFIDGKAFADTKFGANGSGHPQIIRILGQTPGNYDDFIMVSNENLTEPAGYNTVDVAVNCGENGTVSYGGEVVSESINVKNGANAEFTITPAEGFVIDTITYDGQNLTATDNKVTVVAKAGATLSVTFKKEAVAPTIAKTAVISTNADYKGAPAAITYLEVGAGTIGAVKEAGILLGFEGVAEALKLIAYSDAEGKTPVTNGAFAIKVFGDVLHGVQCTSKPFVTYEDAEGEKTGYGEEETFTINE